HGTRHTAHGFLDPGKGCSFLSWETAMVATFREGGLVAWAEASGQRRTSGRAGGGLRFAFYGRVDRRLAGPNNVAGAAAGAGRGAGPGARPYCGGVLRRGGEPVGGLGPSPAGGGAGRPARGCVPGLGRDRGRGVRAGVLRQPVRADGAAVRALRRAVLDAGGRRAGRFRLGA